MQRPILLALLAPAAALHVGAAAAGLRIRGGRAPTRVQMDESEALPSITLSTGDSSCKVYPFGACVTSYTKDGIDYLMVRPDAKMDGSKPISGGIPFCFPQFGPGAMQQHGFARNLNWEVLSQTDGASPTVVFKLTDSEYTRAIWDFPFEATYSVTLGADALATEFKVANTGPAAFTFTGALHSYFSTSSIGNVRIAGGFDGATYLDKTVGEKSTSSEAALAITKETDSVYEGVGGEVTLKDSGRGTALKIASEGWKDTVVWNPYGNEAMGYDKFVCVECAKALEPITVAPGDEWVGKMTLTPASLYGD